MLPPKPRITIRDQYQGYFHQHTLIHEAAHAVIGDVLDVPIYHIQIGPDPGGGGQSKYDDYAGYVLRMRTTELLRHWHLNPYLHHRTKADALHASIILLMAAEEAEKIILDVTVTFGSESDREKAELLLRELGYEGEALIRWKQRLLRHTRTMVRRHTPEILYVWRHLQKLRHPIVSGEELTELLRRAKMYG